MKTAIINTIVSFFMTLIPFNMFATEAPSKPDFAYPKTVAKNAEKQLDNALDNGNGKALVRAIIDLSLAEYAIDHDSIDSIISRINNIATEESNADTKALLNILLADIYSNVYSNSRWEFDSRDLPLSPIPSKIDEWSGTHFQNRITDLCGEALSASEQLKTKNLKDYSDIIIADKHTYSFYPTLYDFIATRAISHLSVFMESSTAFSLSWLCRYDIYENLKFRYTDPTAQTILEIYQELLKFHEGNPAPFAITDVNRIKFVNNHIFHPEASNLTQSAYDALNELYLLLGKSQYAGEALIAMNNIVNFNDNARLNSYINNIDTFLKHHPTYFRADILRNIQVLYSQKSIVISSPSIVSPGESINVETSIKNANSYSLSIFRVPYAWDGSNQYISRRNAETPTFIKTLDFKVEGNIPFETTDSVNISFDTPGCYIIIPSINGKKPSIETNRYYQRIHCTDLSIATASFADKQWAWVINPQTGEPIDAAKLQLYSNQNSGKTFITSSEGMVDLSNVAFPQYNWSLYASKGDDKYAPKSMIYRRQAADTSAIVCANLWTDLAIYHLGDTVRFSGVLYSTQGKEHQLLKSESISLVLRDANYQEKNTTTLITDDWGRVEGSFVLPTEGLTGYFTIEAKHNEKNIQSVSFMVSDYKLPTYQIEIIDISRNAPTSGAVTLKGKAISYSGFPLASINIDIDLSVSQRYRWWYNRSIKYQSLSTTTNDDGTFTVVFPTEMLAEAPIENGIFTARIKATSATGESQETSSLFSLGETYRIACAIDNNSDIDVSSPTTLNIRVIDLMNKEVPLPISYAIIKDDKEVKRGVFSSANPVVDWSKVPGGEYTLQFTLESAELADTVTVNNIGLYRPTDSMPPKSTPVWIPTTAYTLKDSRIASIIYGTVAPEGHICYTIWNNDSIYRQGWLSVKPGMHRFEFSLPEGVDEVTVSMMSTANYHSVQKDISVRTESSEKSISIEAETFRDHITPGAEETWRFRIKDRSGNGTKAALMFDMYSKALDALSSQSWKFNVINQPLNRFAFYPANLSSRYHISKNDEIKYLKESDIVTPTFQMWGMNFSDRGLAPIRGSFGGVRLMKSASAPVAEETVAAFGAANDGVADMGESIEEESGDEAQHEFSYRASETPLAFFRPMLTTADDGSLEFSFIAPNANTTWQFCAIAFSQDLQTVTMAEEILSNKPIMVQPNLPRFIRTGDHADILASVMNNSETVQTVTSTIEIFDPATNAIIRKSQQTDTIAAKESAIAKISIDVPFDTNMFGYRVKSTSASFADGEQSIIPILPSSSPVINTLPFYIAPKDTSFSIQLPEEMPNDALITLEFCENPTWYCVTALPGLLSESSRTAMGAAAEIFSAAVAEGILRNNPTIARAIHQWQTSDKTDSTLVSMLERNQDLKTILLNSTPWVMDARSDTERMARLASLFDKKEIDAVYSHAIHSLAQLQRNKGGWAWIDENNDASIWATYNILSNFGRLKQLGFLPDNEQLSEMISNAVRMIDAEAAEEFRKYPKADYLSYVATRNFYPEIKQSTAASRVTRATVQRLVSDWKDRNIHEKALAAIILNDNGYNATARQILASLREYSRYTPQQGMWWPSLDNMESPFHKLATTSLILDAFHAIEPSCIEIDQIRQWLIIQKEAGNWGTSVVTSDVIASILLTGSNWTRPTATPVIKIGNKEINPSETDKSLGYFRMPIDQASSAGKNLTIAKASDYPSWGAVYCQYINNMNQVEAASCDAVEIEKQLFVQRGAEWISTDSIALGDRVKVQLTIRANRDMDYVAIIDERAACFEPVEQLPRPIYTEGIYFYRENRDAETNIFVNRLPKGVYILNYELYANNTGAYASGIASIQSQYAPALSAHSAGSVITVK